MNRKDMASKALAEMLVEHVEKHIKLYVSGAITRSVLSATIATVATSMNDDVAESFKHITLELLTPKHPHDNELN